MKDLHVHTKYSDGEDDEYTIVSKILEVGIDEFAICDHDTIEGSKKVAKIVSKTGNGIIFHSGVEFTCRVNGFYLPVNVHLLVRDFKYEDKNILHMIETMKKNREEKFNRIVKEAEKYYDIIINYHEVDELKKNTKALGKPHLYTILSKMGYYDRKEFYEIMKKVNTDDLKLDAEEVISLTHKGKGNVTLAHPIEICEDYGFDFSKVDELVGFLSLKGLDGLETQHSKHTKEQANTFSKMAEKYELFETCGSDYHGNSVKPDVFLGKCVKED